MGNYVFYILYQGSIKAKCVEVEMISVINITVFREEMESKTIQAGKPVILYNLCTFVELCNKETFSMSALSLFYQSYQFSVLSILTFSALFY